MGYERLSWKDRSRPATLLAEPRLWLAWIVLRMILVVVDQALPITALPVTVLPIAVLLIMVRPRP